MWAQPSRAHPNGEKLKDGAIQRASVSTQGEALRYVKANPDGVGFYKREELNVKASGGFYQWSNPWDGQAHRYKIARIYMPQRKHVHCHPTNKESGNFWAIDLNTWGNNKSPLMGWTRASNDVYANFACSNQMKFGRLSDAIDFAETQGWGYDVSYPKGQRWHVKKNYADNFKFKGDPKPTAEYD